jgi:hypothetical protein
LIRLECHKTEDSGTDELEMRLYIGGREFKTINDMKKGGRWELDWWRGMYSEARLELWERDSPDPDDKLGVVRIPPQVTGVHHVSFKGDGALYKLYYEVRK